MHEDVKYKTYSVTTKSYWQAYVANGDMGVLRNKQTNKKCKRKVKCHCEKFLMLC